MKNDSDPDTEIQPEEHSATEDEEWGFPAQKRGISKEAKLGISLIFVLLVAFAFVLYPKLFPNGSLDAQRGAPVVAEHAAYGQDAVAIEPPNAVAGPKSQSDPFADLGGSRTSNRTTGVEVNSVSNEFLLETAQMEPPLDRPHTDLHPSGADTAGAKKPPEQATDEFLVPKPSRNPTVQTPKTGPFRQETVASADRSTSVAGSDFIRSSFSEQPEATPAVSHNKPAKPFLMDDTSATSSAASTQSRDTLIRKPIETTSTTLVQAKPVPEQTSLLVQEKKDPVTPVRIDEDSLAFAKPRPGRNNGHTKKEPSKDASHSLPNIEKKHKPPVPGPDASHPFDTLPPQTPGTHKADRVIENSAATTGGLSVAPISETAQKKPKTEPATSQASKPSDAGKRAQSTKAHQQPKANDGRLGDFRPVERQQATSRTVVRQPNGTKSANSVKKPSAQAADASKPTSSSDKLPPLTSAKRSPLVSTPPPSPSQPVLPIPSRSAIGDIAMRSPVTTHPTDPAGAPPAKDTYVVKATDNFWTISKNVYGTSRYFQALALYNKSKISDPRRMRPGTQISTPSPDVLISSFPKLFPSRPSPVPAIRPSDKVASGKESPGFFIGDDGQPFFRVGTHDTLTDIAHRHLGRSSRWIQIYQLNRDRLENPHNLTIGKVLRLPADASRIQFVQKPHNTR